MEFFLTFLFLIIKRAHGRSHPFISIKKFQATLQGMFLQQFLWHILEMFLATKLCILKYCYVLSAENN